MRPYLLIVHGDVEPELVGPYTSKAERDGHALEWRKDDPEMRDGLYRVMAEGEIEIEPYSGGEMEAG